VQATALDSLRINKSLTMDELFAANPAFGRFGGRGVEWINLAFLAGGLWLLQRRVIAWQAPVGMLASLFVVSLLCWNGSGSDSHGSPLFHLLSGATMLGAFFIITEPVSGAKSPLARLLFGVGVGLLTYLIRTWGGYPDGVAFAVLLMNLCVPALERLPPPARRRCNHEPHGFCRDARAAGRRGARPDLCGATRQCAALPASKPCSTAANCSMSRG
jgi:electron transport complex protein RnfD